MLCCPYFSEQSDISIHHEVTRHQSWRSAIPAVPASIFSAWMEKKASLPAHCGLWESLEDEVVSSNDIQTSRVLSDRFYVIATRQKYITLSLRWMICRVKIRSLFVKGTRQDSSIEKRKRNMSGVLLELGVGNLLSVNYLIDMSCNRKGHYRPSTAYRRTLCVMSGQYKK